MCEKLAFKVFIVLTFKLAVPIQFIILLQCMCTNKNEAYCFWGEPKQCLTLIMRTVLARETMQVKFYQNNAKINCMQVIAAYKWI